jgi:hypothetical protein
MNKTTAERIKTQLEQYDDATTHSRSQGYRAAEIALKANIESLNKPPYKAIAYSSGATIFNDGMNLTYEDNYGGDGFSCTIDEFNKLLDMSNPLMTYRVKQYGQADFDFFSNFSSNFSNLYGSLFKPDEANKKLPQRPPTPRPPTPRPPTSRPPTPRPPTPRPRTGLRHFFRVGGAGTRRNKTNRRNRKITHRRNKRHRKSSRRRRHRKH